jgi:glycosyltransferase involved in cell wall biosynthesis
VLSLIVPVYRNEASLPRLLDVILDLGLRLPEPLEVVFVVDGSPDGSFRLLRDRLASWSLASQLVDLSRNFGSFAAITAGLHVAKGDRFAVMAADLQEPPELIETFQRLLASGEADVVFGHREGRSDPLVSRLLSAFFWRLYRRYVVPDMPAGGVDVFACSRQVRDQLVALTEQQSNLVALLLWTGFRRAFVPYRRQARLEGQSAWTLGRKMRYALDSIFSFTDLPIRALLGLGAGATGAALVMSVVVVVSWTLGLIPVLGYTPLILTIMGFGGLTALGLGIVGEYLWLTLQNSRNRPTFIVRSIDRFGGDSATPGTQLGSAVTPVG